MWKKKYIYILLLLLLIIIIEKIFRVLHLILGSKLFTIALDYSEQIHNKLNSNKNKKACEGTQQKCSKQ